MSATTRKIVRYGTSESPGKTALADITSALFNGRLWISLGWLDIKQKYRRAFLGPFWITVSMCILVLSMGILYAGIFRQDIANFLPYIAGGFIVWFFFATTINESAVTFTMAEGLIKHGGIPLTMHALRTVFRNLVTAFHNLAVMVLLYIWQPSILNWNVLLVIPGLALLSVNLLWIGLIVGILCTRFRDLPPIIASLLQVLMFVSPIMYKSELLPPELLIVVRLNPIYYFIEIVRMPLLGHPPPASAYVLLTLSAIVGWALALWLLRRVRARVPYWI